MHLVRRFKWIYVLCFALSINALMAQPGQYTSTKKKAIAHYEAGIKAYEKYDLKTVQPDYKGAESSLKKAIAADDQFIEAYILLAQVYMDWGKNKEAIQRLEQSIAINPDFFPNSFYFLARLQMREAEYEAAKDALRRFLALPRIPAEMKNNAEKLLASAEFAAQAVRNPVPFKPVNLGPGVNTNRPEYFPTITADDQVLLFTRLVSDERSVYGEQEDFFVSTRQADGTWSKGVSVSNRINTPFNEGAPSLSADGQVLIFTACEIEGDYGSYRDGYGSCDLFVSRRRGTEWSRPVNIGRPINTNIWESQPSLSADGRSLYFVRATRGKDGRRTSDIWWSRRNDSGEWEEPKRLSDKINTDGNEASVLIHPDGQTLYFSSDGHPGMGGLDIYMSRRDEKGEWGTPVNLGYPINTSADENSLLVSSDGKVAFFASDRPGGYGGLDLYSFELPENVRPQVTTYLKGVVYNAQTKELLEARFELIDLQTGQVRVESFSDPVTGEFLVAIATNHDYALNVSRPGFNFYSKNFSLIAQAGQTDPFLMDIPLVPIEVAEPIRLDNVFFDFDKYELRTESFPELDKLYEFMRKNPGISVQINGHTDSRGDKQRNQVLSENRAKSVVDYLVAKDAKQANAGKLAERLSYKGYGDTLPKVPNASTEEEHQQNRRTEYEILP